MQADQPLLKLEWFPSYPKLKDALEIYGYLYDLSPSQDAKTGYVCTVSVCFVYNIHTYVLMKLR